MHLHDGKKSKDLTFRGKVTVLMPHQSKVEEWTKSTFSKQNEIDWNKAIQLVKNTNYEKNIALYLKKSLMKGNVTDIPCFVDEAFLSEPLYVFSLYWKYKQVTVLLHHTLILIVKLVYFKEDI